MKTTRIASLAAAFGILVGAGAAHADTWQRNHPRRAEVNGRLANQNYRIDQGVRDGQLDHAQARQLRADDRSIRAEERADASVNGSHITAGEQRQINQQENANSRAIYSARH